MALLKYLPCDYCGEKIYRSKLKLHHQTCVYKPEITQMLQEWFDDNATDGMAPTSTRYREFCSGKPVPTVGYLCSQLGVESWAEVAAHFGYMSTFDTDARLEMGYDELRRMIADSGYVRMADYEAQRTPQAHSAKSLVARHVDWDAALTHCGWDGKKAKRSALTAAELGRMEAETGAWCAEQKRQYDALRNAQDHPLATKQPQTKRIWHWRRREYVEVTVAEVV